MQNEILSHTITIQTLSSVVVLLLSTFGAILIPIIVHRLGQIAKERDDTKSADTRFRDAADRRFTETQTRIEELSRELVKISTKIDMFYNEHLRAICKKTEETD